MAVNKTNMAAPALEDLFDESRFLHINWTLLLLIVYFPFGVILALIRTFALLQFYLAFTYIRSNSVKRHVIKFFATVLGVHVIEKPSGKAEGSASRVWVSNHVTPWDGFVLNVLRDLLAFPRSPEPVFPESVQTNGKRGLLKFQSNILEKICRENNEIQIQPVALSVTRPFPDEIAVTTLDTSVWADLFWLFFSPVTFYVVRYAEPVVKRPDEDLELVVRRVESEIAALLNVPTTPYTAQDKAELIKRRRAEANATANRNLQNCKNNLQVMAAQVKEVLPHVPLSAIISDLGRTSSVDVTITNFVEGLIPFTPENETRPAAPAVASSPPAPKPNVVSSSFGRTPNERFMSLQERKKMFFETARRKYCEKHGIDFNLVR